MMDVWVAFDGYDYEGCDAIGVYTTAEAARTACVIDLRDRSECAEASIEWHGDYGRAHAKGFAPDYYQIKPFNVSGDDVA